MWETQVFVGRITLSWIFKKLDMRMYMGYVELSGLLSWWSNEGK
jgi:hypothetical protein